MQDNTENQANLQRVRLYLFMHDKLRTDGKILVGLSRDAGEQNAKVGKRVGGGTTRSGGSSSEVLIVYINI